MNDQAKMNTEYDKWFNFPKNPTTSCVTVVDRPKNGLVEIEAVFFKL